MSYQAQKDLQRERRQLQKAVELAEENNASIEAKIEKLEADMITANESGDSVKLMDLHKEFQEIQ